LLSPLSPAYRGEGRKRKSEVVGEDLAAVARGQGLPDVNLDRFADVADAAVAHGDVGALLLAAQARDAAEAGAVHVRAGVVELQGAGEGALEEAAVHPA